jgi:transposase
LAAAGTLAATSTLPPSRRVASPSYLWAPAALRQPPNNPLQQVTQLRWRHPARRQAFDADQRVIKPLEANGKACVIPPNQSQNPRPFDKEIYRVRHLTDFYCSLKRFRAIATRYGTTALNFPAAIHIAAAIVWLN